MPVLSQEDLQQIAQHQYQGEDLSITGKYVLTPYWEACTRLVPRWVAPNLITLAGCLWVYVGHLVLLAHTPNLDGPAPAWVYYLQALAVWMFQTLDAMDGKQARRTRFIYPTGDLFDHGSDIVTFSFIVVTLGAVMQLGTDAILVQVVCAVVVPSYFYHWEMRYTHKLTLGVFNGPIEGLLMAVGYYVVSAIKGPMFWLTPLNELLGMPSLPAVPINLVAVAVQVLFTVLTVIPICMTVRTACRQQKKSFVLQAWRDLSMLVVVSLPLIAWAVVHDGGALDVYRIAPLYAVTFACSDAQNRQIVARLAKKQPPLVSPLALPCWLLLLNTTVGYARGGVPLVNEVHMMVAVAVALGLMYAVYVVRVLRAVCGHLGIRCFSTALHPRGASTATTATAGGSSNAGSSSKPKAY